MDPEKRLQLTNAYIAMYVDSCGAEYGIPAALDALDSALYAHYKLADERWNVTSGDLVIVWPRGRTQLGERLYAGWAKCMPITELLFIEESALEIGPHRRRSAQ
jgi:hypothetical protein